METDVHTLGLFPLNTWKQVLGDAGFLIHEQRFVEDQGSYLTFVCIKPR